MDKDELESAPPDGVHDLDIFPAGQTEYSFNPGPFEAVDQDIGQDCHISPLSLDMRLGDPSLLSRFRDIGYRGVV